MKMKILSLSVLLAISSSVHSATVAYDFPTSGSVTNINTLQLNSFTTLSADGTLALTPDGAIGAPATAVFTFDTAQADVTEFTIGGGSNNASVDVSVFDIDGNWLITETTDRFWTSDITITGVGSIGSVEVSLLESAIQSMSVTYQPVSAVPVPAAVWLFGSGVIGLAAVARRRA